MERLRRCSRLRIAVVAMTVLVTGIALDVQLAEAAPADAVGPTFGNSGLVVTPVRPDSSDFATSLAVQPDEQVVVAAAAGGDFGVARADKYLNKATAFGLWDGKRVTDFGGTNDVARTVAVTSAGNVVAAGSAGGDVAVARYDRAGILDPSFDGDGRLTVDLGGQDDSAYAVVVLPDDRVLVVGGTASSVVVIRLFPDGRADPAFGSAGRVAVASSGPGRAAAVQGDGKIVVAGGGDRFVAHRLLADGALDPGFGQAGVALVGGGPATAHAMVLGADGAVTLGGTRGADVAVARLQPSGQPDATFGSAGVSVSDFGGVEAGFGLARQDDGRLMLVGDAGDKGLMVSYRPDGSLDTSFSSTGHRVTVRNSVLGTLVSRLRAVVARPDGSWLFAGAQGSDAFVGDPLTSGQAVTVDFGRQHQLVTSSAVQPDGKVVGVAVAGDGVAIVRYNPDGTRDGRFGVGGIVVSDRITLPSAVALQPNGRIVVAGTAVADARSAAMIGFRSDGTVDPSFGTDAGTVTDRTGGNLRAAALAVLPDARILLLGGGTDGAVVLDRFTESGRPDPTFAQVVAARLLANDTAPRQVVVQADGRILIVGPAQSVVRLNADGSRDSTFGDGGAVSLRRPDFAVPRTLALQPDGRILVAGIDRGSMSVIRLRPDGSPDPTWQQRTANFGTVINGPTAGSDPSTVTLQPDGRVLLAGNANGSPGVVRLLADGTHDPTFGTDGLTVIPVASGESPVLVVQTPSSGMLVLATSGSSAFPTDGFQLARIATGQLGAPTAVTAVAGSGSARVRWSRPPLFDDSPLLAYKVTASDGVHSATTRDAAHLSAVVRGLTTGRSYTFTVQAVRVAGEGARSTASNTVTPGLSSPTSAWGWNGAMQLGDATAVDRTAPVTGVGVSGVIALAGGAYHSMALRADGTVWTWGWNGLGALGDGTRTNRSTAVRVPGLSDITAIASGAYHSMALRADGTVWTWGWNGFGQLGMGTSGDIQLSPVQARGLTGAKAIAAGFHHSLAVRSDGAVMSWGWNIYGQLGDGSTVDRALPIAVPGLPGSTGVAGGALHSVALGADGQIRTWGWNGVGQLGSQDYVDRSTPGTVELHAPPVESIVAGAFHNYALLRDGTVVSWGWNGYGQLGNVTAGSVSWPQGVGHLDDVVSISAGWFHGLAVRHDGSVAAWGDNRFGQLGDGTTAGRNTIAPVKVPIALAAAGGAFHSISS